MTEDLQTSTPRPRKDWKKRRNNAVYSDKVDYRKPSIDYKGDGNIVPRRNPFQVKEQEAREAEMRNAKTTKGS